MWSEIVHQTRPWRAVQLLHNGGCSVDAAVCRVMIPRARWSTVCPCDLIWTPGTLISAFGDGVEESSVCGRVGRTGPKKTGFFFFFLYFFFLRFFLPPHRVAARSTRASGPMDRRFEPRYVAWCVSCPAG